MLVVIILLFVVTAALLVYVSRRAQGAKLKAAGAWALALSGLSAVACCILSLVGASYTQNYHATYHACPANHPYASAIMWVGVAGLIGLICLAYWSHKQRSNLSGALLLVAGIIFALFVYMAAVASSFCLTF